MLIDDTKVVTLVYTLSVLHSEGHVEFVDKRGEENPLEFVFGRGLLLPKVEAFLTGRARGYTGQLKLKPEDAFGLRDESLVLQYPLDKLPKGSAPKLGMKYQTQGPNGEVLSVLVTAIDESKVTLDGNHPLADAFVQFDLSVVKVREATPEELSSGEPQTSRLH